MEDRYLKVLRELEPHGIDIETDMTDTINSIVSEIQKTEPSNWTFDDVKKRFLDILSLNEHVGNGLSDDGKLMLRLHFKGLQYLNEYRLTTSNITLNEKIKSSLRTQIFIGIITMSAIGLTAYYDGQNLNKTQPEPTSLKKLDTLLQRQVQLLDSIQLLQKERETNL